MYTPTPSILSSRPHGGMRRDAASEPTRGCRLLLNVLTICGARQDWAWHGTDVLPGDQPVTIVRPQRSPLAF
jgi:hypothetical protein